MVLGALGMFFFSMLGKIIFSFGFKHVFFFSFGKDSETRLSSFCFLIVDMLLLFVLGGERYTR